MASVELLSHSWYCFDNSKGLWVGTIFSFGGFICTPGEEKVNLIILCCPWKTARVWHQILPHSAETCWASQSLVSLTPVRFHRRQESFFLLVLPTTRLLVRTSRSQAAWREQKQSLPCEKEPFWAEWLIPFCGSCFQIWQRKVLLPLFRCPRSLSLSFGNAELCANLLFCDVGLWK